MQQKTISPADSKFLAYLRALSIFVIVFGHVGGFWVFKPYSEFLHVFVPVFFFISGAVSYYSFNRAPSTLAYYKKRLVGLLVPYYLLCLLSLAVYIATRHHFPSVDINSLWRWLQIRPSNAIMVFPVGQVWFLHTLFFITAVSPLIFKLYNQHKGAVYILVLLLLLFSTTNSFLNVNKALHIFDNNLYKPVIHSIFYIFGMLSFSNDSIRTKKNLFALFGAGILFSIISVYFFGVSVDYNDHINAPGIYFVSGSVAAISLLLLFARALPKLIDSIKPLKIGANFFYRHTFSIYLLHTFAIFLAENIFGLVEPDKKNITYGLTKLTVVLVITCLLAVPFTSITQKISALLLRKTT
jgi:peptidoglycan/LPS O-acetylase OafA/YrhL